MSARRRAIACARPAVLALSALLAASTVPAFGGLRAADPTSAPVVGAPLEPRSACELLDDADAADVLELPIFRGEDVSGIIVDAAGWLSECRYVAAIEPFQPVLDLVAASGPAAIDGFGDLRVEPGAVGVDGLGDDAVLRLTEVWGLAEPVGSLHVRVGDTVIGLQLGVGSIGPGGTLVQLGDGARQAEILDGLARLVVAGLEAASQPGPASCPALAVEDAARLLGMPIVAAAEADGDREWGAACHYTDADGRVLLALGVLVAERSRAHADACLASGEPVPGVGEAAATGTGPGCAAISVGSYLIEGPLVVRSGETWLVVAAVDGDWPGVNPTGSRDAQVAVARQVLGALGEDPGATSAPVDRRVLEHPCDLLRRDEVGTVVGVEITGTDELPADALSAKALCIHAADEGNVRPLTLTLTVGPEALDAWGSFGTWAKGAKAPVEGLGDGALTEAHEGQDIDQPLVSLWVLSGDALLQLDLGPVERLQDYTFRAAGSPDDQLAMLRRLAELILQRVRG